MATECIVSAPLPQKRFLSLPLGAAAESGREREEQRAPRRGTRPEERWSTGTKEITIATLPVHGRFDTTRILLKAGLTFENSETWEFHLAHVRGFLHDAVMLKFNNWCIFRTIFEKLLFVDREQSEINSEENCNYIKT